MRASLVELGTSLVRCVKQVARTKCTPLTSVYIECTRWAFTHFFVFCGSFDYRGSLGSNRDIVTSQSWHSASHWASSMNCSECIKVARDRTKRAWIRVRL